MDEEALKDIQDMCENDEIENSLKEMYDDGEIEKDVFDFFNDMILRKVIKDNNPDEKVQVNKESKAVKRVTFAEPLVDYETFTMDHTSE